MKKHTRRLFIRGLLVSIFTLIVMLSYGIDPAKALIDSSAGKIQKGTGFGSMPLFFIPNQSQFDERLKYTVQGKDKSIFFTAQRLTIVFIEQDCVSPSTEPRTLREIYPQKPGSRASQKSWVIKLDFVGANHSALPGSLDQAETMVSYFQGPV